VEGVHSGLPKLCSTVLYTVSDRSEGTVSGSQNTPFVCSNVVNSMTCFGLLGGHQIQQVIPTRD
jgi:hypothetical protein